MQRLCMVSAVLFAAVALAGRVRAEEVECGLKAGDEAGAFNVLDVTGPNKDQSLCYR